MKYRLCCFFLAAVLLLFSGGCAADRLSVAPACGKFSSLPHKKVTKKSVTFPSLLRYLSLNKHSVTLFGKVWRRLYHIN